ncbi:MAG: hypothetical protein M1814_002181 [Vezdaea aestivalis]|nr:MAG: hypothetical protein M1814_002181 [Vezdaea aestivalis]
MAEVYDTTRFGELYYASQNPPTDNLGLACKYLIELSSRNQIEIAVHGGWALFLRGGNRNTNDVDLAVHASMEDLIKVLKQENRLCIPKRYGKTCLTIFVHTGGTWDNGYVACAVYVDLIIGGNLGTPADIPTGTELIIPIQTAQGLSQVRVTSVDYLFAAKLDAFYNRRSENDFYDLSYLINTAADKIFSFRNQLNMIHRQVFFDVFASRNRSNEEYLKYMRKILELPI